MTRRSEDFDVYVTEASGRLLRSAYLLCGDWAAAEDLLQEVLEGLYVAWPRVGDPAAYTRRALVHRARNRWRRRGRRPGVPLRSVHETSTPDSTDHQADRDVLMRALRSLPHGQRAVIVLRYFEDLPESEIAAALGCSTGTVKSQASRAMTRLRRELGEPCTTPAARSQP